MPSRTEAGHPIGVVSDRTGLSPDVLRVWERRYGVVRPKRSAGGQRVYSDADIDRLSLLHRALRGGHGISHAAALSRSKLEDLVRDVEGIADSLPVPVAVGRDFHGDVSHAMQFVRALDPAGLESFLRRSVARYGMIAFLDSVAAALLRRIGDDWHAGSLEVSEEHLATAVVQRVVSETVPLLISGEGNPTIVIATLEGERHASGALMAAATAASEAWRVIYLGADLAASDVAQVAVKTGARGVGISTVFVERKTRLAASLRELERSIPDSMALLVGGTAAKGLKKLIGPTRIAFIESMAELRVELVNLAAKSG